MVKKNARGTPLTWRRRPRAAHLPRWRRAADRRAILGRSPSHVDL